MRAALIALALAAAAGVGTARAGPPAAAAAGTSAGVPLALAERQVLTLEFDRRVSRVSVTDPDLLAIRSHGSRVELAAQRGGRSSLEIAFEDGAVVAYEVTVSAARRPAAATAGTPGAIALGVGEERRLRASGADRVLVEENGVARVRADAEGVTILGASPGVTSVVLVDAAGARTTWTVTVR